MEDNVDGYADAAPLYWKAGWRGVLPIPRGKKLYPPTGYTGHGGLTPSYADIQTWIDTRGGDNICLRLPENAVGIGGAYIYDSGHGNTAAGDTTTGSAATLACVCLSELITGPSFVPPAWAIWPQPMPLARIATTITGTSAVGAGTAVITGLIGVLMIIIGGRAAGCVGRRRQFNKRPSHAASTPGPH